MEMRLIVMMQFPNFIYNCIVFDFLLAKAYNLFALL